MTKVVPYQYGCGYLFLVSGEPAYIRNNNGPEFTARKIKKWLKDMGVKTLFIEPDPVTLSIKAPLLY